MTSFRVQDRAGHRLDEIYVYTRERWGDEQAERYIRGLFDCFEQIASKEIPWRTIPGEFGVDGYYCRHEHHYIYWRVLSDGTVGIVTVLHKRVHQSERFGEDRPR
ncbi:type II toxin-antitoxin system RelE/ParE family toxin [Croceicoccus marinus]|uniref:Type II toxin-antitoxin system RelE/ParE family toxin n=1 Tax=Croceicoccus marinus TaxID=450378 RepID=A0A7G6VZH1_9SPHN|nr:type II toxin-antitoxin system RelE/ParE family toxin [Croceicoccus marinus]QNE07136.1 type II toxin-antitoxin system RelE/ParE family toxin [Croceicoccus marinus]